jgi:hypothetical protein
MDSIISCLSQLTIDNRTAAGAVNAKFERLKDAFCQLTLIGPVPAPLPSLGPQVDSDISSCSGHEAEDLSRLWVLDEEFDLHVKSILQHLDSLLSPNLLTQTQVKLNLLEEKRGLQNCLRELRGLESHLKPDIRVIGEVMHDRMA